MKPFCFSLLLAVPFLLSTLFTVRADIAPPDQPSGANPLPGKESTLVRMLSEEVLIEVLRNTPQDSLGQAHVTAQFTMQNLAREAESMPVRFPLTFFGEPSGDPVPSAEIKDVKVKVNGRQVPTRRVNYSWSDEPPSPWIEFDVAFPPLEKIPIEVSYLQEGAGEYPFLSLDYTLETGAGWNGTIGSADLIVRLPYESNPQNMIFDEQIGWAQTTPGGVIEGREVRWHYENLNPGREHNLQVALVQPRVWRQVLDEQARIARNPQDGEAWGRLGKLYKETSRLRRGQRSDPGGQALYQMSVDAYERAIELKPEDAAWHAGFADLLWVHYYYDQSFLEQPDHTEMLRALEELDRALSLDPNQAKAQEILLDISYALPEAVSVDGDRYTVSWLTATPTRQPSVTPTEEVVTPVPASPTPIPSFTPSQAPASPISKMESSSEGTPKTAIRSPAEPATTTPPPASAGRTGGLCGAALLPLAAAFWLGRRR